MSVIAGVAVLAAGVAIRRADSRSSTVGIARLTKKETRFQGIAGMITADATTLILSS